MSVVVVLLIWIASATATAAVTVVSNNFDASDIDIVMSAAVVLRLCSAFANCTPQLVMVWWRRQQMVQKWIEIFERFT